MSYYCSYKLKVELDPNCNAPLSMTKEKMCSYIIKAARIDYDWMNEAFDEDGNTIESLSGAEWEKDFSRFSKQFPHTILTVDVIGEEDEPLRGYFKNGKSHIVVGEVVFEQYDEGKLK